MPDRSARPDKAQRQQARGKAIQPVIADGLDVLFCGINPSLDSGATGHHFAGPGNRFWKVLYEAGFTDRLVHFTEDQVLLEYGCGITNLVNYATGKASELTAAQLQQGARDIARTVQKHHPAILAVVGISAYRVAFKRPKARVGRQDDHQINNTIVWVLPNPSGLNAHYQMPDLVRLYRRVRGAASHL